MEGQPILQTEKLSKHFGALTAVHEVVTEQWNLIIGILFIFCVLTFRRGIVGELKERFFPKGI
jgi:ABC-type branched-subunit amino acid transport system permease subunit